MPTFQQEQLNSKGHNYDKLQNVTMTMHYMNKKVC